MTDQTRANRTLYVAIQGDTVKARAYSYTDLIAAIALSKGDKIEAVEAYHDHGLTVALCFDMYLNGQKTLHSCTSANDPIIGKKRGYTVNEAMDYFLACYADRYVKGIYTLLRTF